MATKTSTKAAAKRKATATKVPGSDVAHIPTALATSLSNASARPTQFTASPTLSLPGGTKAVTPVAPPTFDPSLSPTDEANRSIDLGQWDDYTRNLDQQRDTQAADVKLNTGNIDRSLASGLESNDWNSAARGIGDSSIKAQNRAQMVDQATAQRTAETDKQTTFGNYVAGQHNQVDTVYKPAINKKYDDLATRNAADAAAAWHAAHPDTGQQDAAGGNSGNPAPTTPQSDTLPNGQPNGTAGAGGPAAPNQAPTISAGGQQQQASGQSGYEGVVKNGKFYHVYGRGTSNERWVFVRNAS